MKENGFTLKKAKSRQYSTSTITDLHNTDDLAFLEFLLHNLEQAARGIGLNVNLDKTDFMRFNLQDAISTLNGKPLKLVNQFTYFSSKWC